MTTATKLTTVEVLEQANDILTAETWGKGDLFCEGGRVCALGAVYQALGVTGGEGGDLVMPGGLTLPDFDGPEYDAQLRAYDEVYEQVAVSYGPASKALDSAARELYPYVPGTETPYVSGVVKVNDRVATDVSEVKAVFALAISNLKENQ